MRFMFETYILYTYIIHTYIIYILVINRQFYILLILYTFLQFTNNLFNKYIYHININIDF